jgi:hypothetical protein
LDGQYFHQTGPGQAIFYAAHYRDFEVQVRTFNSPHIYGGNALHCGIAAREGNNIVKFRFCPGDNNDIVVDFKSPLALRPTVSVLGSQYFVSQ